MNPVLGLDDVHFDYLGKTILEGLTADFEEGTTTVILGSSGSGKSTFLKVAAGLMVHQKGSVLYRGQSIDWLGEAETVAMRRDLGFVFQDAALWANKTVYQNLELPLRFHFPKMDHTEVWERIAAITQRLGVRDELENRPSQLSSGEQQLVSLARALIIDPSIVLLDEPTANLDGQSRQKVLEILQEQKTRGKTIVLVNQFPELTSRLADRLLLLKHGRILVQGPFAQVVKNPDPQVVEILTSVLSQASTFSSDILDLLGG